MRKATTPHSTHIADRRGHWKRCRDLGRRYMVGIALIIAGQSTLAQSMYRITPLGYLAGGCTELPIVRGLNESDQVTGSACDANGNLQAFLWTNDGTPMEDIGPNTAGSTSEGAGVNASGVAAGDVSGNINFVFTSTGDGAPLKRIVTSQFSLAASEINDLGQVTGNASLSGNHEYSHAFLWRNDGSPVVDLGALGPYGSTGLAINALGQVTGYSSIPGKVYRVHGFIWKNDGTPMLDLGTLGGLYSNAYLINASGQVVGVSTLKGTVRHDGPQHGFLWKNDGTPMQDLGSLIPFAFNDSGRVAGRSFDPVTPHALVWLNDGSPLHDLGTLSGSFSEARAMNALGQVTGDSSLAGDAVYHAFLWTDDGTRMKDLNKLIDPADPLKSYVTLNMGDFINNRSDVVAEGTDSRTGQQGLYLLKSTGVATSAITVTPRSLAFGNVTINTSSATQSVTVTNTTSNTVAITGIALRGSAPKQFSFTDDCGLSLAGHATCTLKAQFTPSATGAKTAFLDVNGGGGGLRSVKLTGAGTGT